jgi:hypothetical protein
VVDLDIFLTVMEGFHKELGEDKYHPAILLRKVVRDFTIIQNNINNGVTHGAISSRQKGCGFCST